MRAARAAPLIPVLLVLLAATAHAEEFTGKVVGVADGDTVTVLRDQTPVKIRLQAVDCPEKAQPFGEKAKQFTSDLVFGKQVIVKVATNDKYGRTVGGIEVAGKNLQEELLRAGFAWHYKQYDKSSKLAQLEDEARKAKRGLWADANPTPPWEWRHGKQQKPDCQVSTDCTLRPCCCQWVAFAKNGPLPEKCSLRCRCANPRTIAQGATCIGGRCQVVEAAPLVSGPFHGNTKSKIFHRAGCKGYDCKHCTAVFKTLEEAKAAGYRPHEACMKDQAPAQPAPPARPRLPWSEERMCRKDADCLFKSTVCYVCPACEPSWRPVVGRRWVERWKKQHPGESPCPVPHCRHCQGSGFGNKTVCVRGQCEVR